MRHYHFMFNGKIVEHVHGVPTTRHEHENAYGWSTSRLTIMDIRDQFMIQRQAKALMQAIRMEHKND